MPTTEIRFPTTNDIVYHDTDCMIVWNYSEQDAKSMPMAVDIELQRARDGRPVRTIAQRVRNQGSFFWSLGSNVPTGGPFRLFVGNMFMAYEFSDFPSSASSSVVQSNANAIYSGPFRIQRSSSRETRCSIAPSLTFANTADSLSEAIASMSVEEDADDADERPMSERQMVATTSEDEEADNDGAMECDEQPKIGSRSPALASGMLSVALTQQRRHQSPKKSAVQVSTRKSASAAAAAATSANNCINAGRSGGATRETTPLRGISGASSFALDASGSGGGGGYTAASNNSLSDSDKEMLCAYIYSCVQMPASVIRRNLKEIVGSDDITPNTILSTDMRAGQFCIYYLLQRYYKKQLMRSNAALERQIDKEDRRIETLDPFLMRVLNVPRAYRGLNAPSGTSGSGASVVVCGGSISNDSVDIDVTRSRNGIGDAPGQGGSSDDDDDDDARQYCLTESGTCGDANDLSGSQSGASRKEMSACVDGVSIRLEREYLQRIRCWSLNITECTLVDTERLITAEHFALQYVQTDRRKRIENTRRSKDKRRQREQQDQ